MRKRERRSNRIKMRKKVDDPGQQALQREGKEETESGKARTDKRRG